MASGRRRDCNRGALAAPLSSSWCAPRLAKSAKKVQAGREGAARGGTSQTDQRPPAGNYTPCLTTLCARRTKEKSYLPLERISILSRRIISHTFQSKNKPDLRHQKYRPPSAQPGANTSSPWTLSDPPIQYKQCMGLLLLHRTLELICTRLLFKVSHYLFFLNAFVTKVKL